MTEVDYLDILETKAKKQLLNLNLDGSQSFFIKYHS